VYFLEIIQIDINHLKEYILTKDSMNSFDLLIEEALNTHHSGQLYNEIYNFSKFYKNLNCKNVLEIGSFLGGTFFLLCKLSNKDGLKCSIDYPMYDSQEELMQADNTYEKMKSFSSNVKIVRANSHEQSTLLEITELLNGEKFDFIFIDGDHTYEGVKLDFNMYKPLLKDGGYIAFHDINDTQIHKQYECYVSKLWNELNNYKKIEFNSNGYACGIGLVQIYI